MHIKSFRDLEAWKQGIDLVEHCYLASRRFPVEERYGLTSQMRRAATSIPSNIAEGHCRKTTAAYANHVSIACGSEGELETCTAVGKILTGLSSSLEMKLLAARYAGDPRRPGHRVS